MLLMRYLLFTFTPFYLLSLAIQAQSALPAQWHHLDPIADKTIGISTERAYELLKTVPTPKLPRTPVTVAVIDGGIDLNHEALKAVLWTNLKEVAGNGKDDDGSGYVDDMYGWNFLGGKDGGYVGHLPKEETRLYARLKPLYEGKDRSGLTPTQQRDYDQWLVVKLYFERKRYEIETVYLDDLAYLKKDTINIERLKKAFGVNVLDAALLHRPSTADTALLRLARDYYRAAKLGPGFANTDSILANYARFDARLKARLDQAYNPLDNSQTMIGDNPANLIERVYGNTNLVTPLGEHGTFHGTHVAGIIAADRTNNLGVKGIADQVRILSVRCIPDGDERDETIRYADQKGVLLIHAAGNDRLDLNSARQYPTLTYLTGQIIPNMMTAGATGSYNDSTLATPFSNCGRHTVDVFAPGAAIWS